MVPGPAMEATAAAVENLLEMQIPRPQPRTTEPGNLGRTSSLYFDEPFRKFWDNAWKTQIQNKKNLGFNQLSTVYLLNDHSVSSLSLTFLICKITQSAKICKHFPCWLSGEESTCQRRSHGRPGFIPGRGRSPGRGSGNPLQDSCRGNPTERSLEDYSP